MKYLLLILTFVSVGSAIGQDVHFSQFWNTPIQINPAQTGLISGNMRFGLLHRNQWASIVSPYKTYSFNGDYKFETSGGTDIGAGLNVYNDVAGDTKMSTTNIQLSVSSILSINDNNTVSVGLMGGLVQKSLNPNAMIWGNQYQNGSYNSGADAGEVVNMSPGMKADISAGLLYVYHSKDRTMSSNDGFRGTIGFSLNHINTPKTSWTVGSPDVLHRNMLIHGGLNIGVSNSKLSIIPGFLVMIQGPSKELMAGSMFRYEIKGASHMTGNVKGTYVSLGAYMRLGDAIIPALQLEYDKYMLGLSYDYTTSGLQSGGFEISLKFQMNTKKIGGASFSTPRSI